MNQHTPRFHEADSRKNVALSSLSPETLTNRDTRSFLSSESAMLFLF